MIYSQSCLVQQCDTQGSGIHHSVYVSILYLPIARIIDCFVDFAWNRRLEKADGSLYYVMLFLFTHFLCRNVCTDKCIIFLLYVVEVIVYQGLQRKTFYFIHPLPNGVACMYPGQTNKTCSCLVVVVVKHTWSVLHKNLTNLLLCENIKRFNVF